MPNRQKRNEGPKSNGFLIDKSRFRKPPFVSPSRTFGLLFPNPHRHWQRWRQRRRRRRRRWDQQHRRRGTRTCLRCQDFARHGMTRRGWWTTLPIQGRRYHTAGVEVDAAGVLARSACAARLASVAANCHAMKCTTYSRGMEVSLCVYKPRVHIHMHSSP